MVGQIIYVNRKDSGLSLCAVPPIESRVQISEVTEKIILKVEGLAVRAMI